MSFFDNLFGFIKGAVGNNMDNDQEDVLIVKRNLNSAGYFDNLDQDREPHGFITKEMDAGIRTFQKDKGLKVDGILLPQGETENSLHSLFQKIGEKIEKEELPSQLNNQKLIPGTNIPDQGVWEGDVPYKSRFDLKDDDHAVPIRQIKPPQSDIDPPMELPYNPADRKFSRKYRDI
jgi:peptidoglycan hydrolase-like protein with peptidoglycan-binding domain